MSTSVLFDQSQGVRRAVDNQDFMAVILVGYGENLYPFNQGTNVVSKALLPIGNVPIINSVVDWVFAAGLRDVLIIVPPSFYNAVAEHVTEHYSMATHPRARIDIKRTSEGEKDDDDESSEANSKAGGRDGTARLLRRFKNWIRTDFVLLPCDLSPPSSLPLTSILDKHRSSPDAVLTSVFYEPPESVKDGEEKVLVAVDKKSDELLLIQPLESLGDDLELRMALINSHPTLSLTTRLSDAHIYVLRRTVLDLLSTRRTKDLDSMREQVIPWLNKGGWQKGLGRRWAPILNPPRKDPFAAALARSTTTNPSSSPYSTLSPGSSPSSEHAALPPTTPASSGSRSGSQDDSMLNSMIIDPEEDVKASTRKDVVGWKCKVIICAPTTPATPATAQASNSASGQNQGKGQKGKAVVPEVEPDYLIRANSLAGYWELNRRFLKSLSLNGMNGTSKMVMPKQNQASVEDATGSTPAISPQSQISPDSLIGEGTRVAERASIKKCIIGRHCNIGKGAKLTGCVLWDFVTVEENARIENTIICSNGRIGEKSQTKDCEFGTGFEAKPGAILKGEKLVAGQEA
ncbi:uncharacterized protein I303_101975 [Kwoniella dejecticola CBS 10117]|uniref:Translation initiation factor eIF2B subunit gamma n=1 Tax=Kwoniella dejecticola CBS 10117 TaxID=1296121 RepID=A0A1A6ACA3_9TREE|nr:translation initiation factor eIF-2B subunit gamma [Kwoniella dejecticola CBS 10117]OBR87680.1 translation initiation factor eIF-2B subunit gamma [Kwoniella dejecticola CBS 10117]